MGSPLMRKREPRGIFVCDLGSGGVALFADDEEEADLDAGFAQAVCRGYLGGDDSFGVAGAAAVEVEVVFGTAEVGRNGVHVGGEDDVGRDAGYRGVDVEALVATGAGGGVVGLLDGHALDGVLLRGEVLVQERAGEALVVGGGLDVYKLPGECNGVDRHAHRIRYARGPRRAAARYTGLHDAICSVGLSAFALSTICTGRPDGWRRF